MYEKYLFILTFVFVGVCGFGGYYIWCTYHPMISVGVGGSGVAENFYVEEPLIVMSDL